MAEDRVITLRFREWKAVDMELYRNLEKGKQETGLSMPAYVKNILCRYLEQGQKEDAGLGDCMEQIQEIVHREFASQNAVITGTIERIAEKFPGAAAGNGQTGQLQENGFVLPEYSDSFPDGLNGVLEKFM